MNNLHSQDIMLNGKLHQSEDDNFTVCGEYCNEGSGGFAIEHPPKDSGIPDCPYCLAVRQGEQFAESFFHTPIRALNIDQQRIVESAAIEMGLERAGEFYHGGDLDQSDGSQSGFYRWFGLFVEAVHRSLNNSKKAVTP